MIKTVSATVAAATVLSAVTLPHADANPPRRGSIVTTQHVQHLSAQQVRAALVHDSFDASAVRFGVDAYRVVYRTIDLRGRPTRASGLVVIPRNEQHRLRVVSYAHGTMAGRDEAPSVDSGGRSDEGLAFASAGFAASEPDYLGLGTGPGRHPYLHLRSEVSAQLDMLLAAFAFSRQVHRTFDPRILVTGFSQGGAAAMAFGKALRNRVEPRFRLAADAPISGPYALTGQELPAAFDGRLDPTAAAFYLAYVTVSWNRIYHLYDSVSDVFAAPYDRTVAGLFDGNHEDGEIFAALPRSPQQLFTPSWLHALQHPSGRLLAAARQNQTACRGWRPAPIRIFAAHGDDQVAIGNAYSCQRRLADDGVQSTLVDTGPVGHPQSGQRGLAAAIAWFQHYQQ